MDNLDTDIRRLSYSGKSEISRCGSDLLDRTAIILYKCESVATKQPVRNAYRREAIVCLKEAHALVDSLIKALEG